jgi:hypothetical protein
MRIASRWWLRLIRRSISDSGVSRWYLVEFVKYRYIEYRTQTFKHYLLSISDRNANVIVSHSVHYSQILCHVDKLFRIITIQKTLSECCRLQYTRVIPLVCFTYLILNHNLPLVIIVGNVLRTHAQRPQYSCQPHLLIQHECLEYYRLLLDSSSVEYELRVDVADIVQR